MVLCDVVEASHVRPERQLRERHFKAAVEHLLLCPLQEGAQLVEHILLLVRREEVGRRPQRLDKLLCKRVLISSNQTDQKVSGARHEWTTVGASGFNCFGEADRRLVEESVGIAGLARIFS